VSGVVILLVIEALILSEIKGEVEGFIFAQLIVYPLSIVGIFLTEKISKLYTEKEFIVKIMILGFILRVGMMFILYFLLNQLQGGHFYYGKDIGDDWSYHKVGLLFKDEPTLILKNFSLFPVDYSLYPFLVALIYKYLIPHTLVARGVNVVINSITVGIFYLFVKNVTQEERIPKLATLFFCFSPSFIFFSSLQLKDAMLVGISFSLLLICSKIWKEKNIIKLGILSILYFAISYSFFYIRVQFFFLFLLFYLLSLIYNFKIFFLNHFNLVCTLVVVGILMFKGVSLISQIPTEALWKLKLDFILMEFARFEKWRTMEKLGILLPIVTAGLGLILPLPLLIRLPHPSAPYCPELIKLPLALEIFFTAPILVLGVYQLIKKKEKKGLMKTLVFLIIIYGGLVVTNFITYERHRLLFTGLSFLFIAYKIVKGGLNFNLLFWVYFLQGVITFGYNFMRGGAHGVL